MSRAGDAPTVLVADDDVDFTDTISFWLREDYDVRTAYSGDEALEQYDETVDIALLDRWLSEWDGDELLTAIRERPGQCYVSIVTAAEPDLDLLELPFEEYLMKPVGKTEVTEAVERLLDLRGQDEGIREYYALRTTLGILESPRRAPHVSDTHALDDLRERVREKRAQLGASRAQDLNLDRDSTDYVSSSVSHGKTTD